MPTADLSRLINRELASLRDELLAYPDEQLDLGGAQGLPNSAGNLALHLVGNLRFYIGTQLGATGFVRDRDAEFAKKGVPACRAREENRDRGRRGHAHARDTRRR